MKSSALLACGALLPAGLAHGMPHETLPPNPVIQVETPQPGVWLKRLMDGFKFDGVIHHEELVDPDSGGPPRVMNEWTQPMQGKGDCIGFADGPGLQCVINLVWPEQWNELTGKASLGGVTDVNPAMVLAGIDPATSQIRFLMVTKRGFGYPGRAELGGDTAIIRPACVDLPGVQRCDQKVAVSARAEARTLQTVVSTTVRFMRYKKDRDPFWQPSRGDESPIEWLDELLEVSFGMQRAALTSANAPAAPEQP